MWFRSFLTVTLAAVMLSSPPVRGDVVMLQASKDNTLYEDENGSLSNGAGDHFFVGRTRQSAGEAIRRGLIAFDVASQIPPGSTINSVTLRLNCSRERGGTEDISLHRALSDWGEGSSHAPDEEGAGTSAEPGDATWLHTFYDTLLWNNPGGDFAGSASATTPVGSTGFYTWSDPGMVTDVEGWVNSPSTNFGWVVLGNETLERSAKRFDTRQNSNSGNRPVLTVDFDPPGGTGACCFNDGTCSVLTETECGNQGGTFQGLGTPCSPNPCPQVGACCIGQTCSILTETECGTQGGVYRGDGTVCSPNPCLPTGACCFSGAVCDELTETECGNQGGVYQGNGTTCSPNNCTLFLEPYVDDLPIPPVMQPVSGTPGGVATYDIAMQEVQQQLHRDLQPTTVWGYNGAYPAATIEAYTDAPVTVNWINDLRDASGNLRTEHYLPVDLCPHGPNVHGNTPRTVVHLHGGHVPMEVDGYPEFTFLPGQQEQYVYPNNQPATTAWVHDHALGITRLNVYMGLAGYYIIRDDFEQGLTLPDGQFEIPIVIQDRAFNNDGTWQYPAQWEEHFFGDTILVNGKVWPYLDVRRGKYRFRILNGSNSRTYQLTLSNGLPFHQIGTDGGLLEAPVTVTELTLASGERADVVVDFEGRPNGEEIILMNSAPAPFPGDPGVGVIPNIMKFVVEGGAAYTDPLPATLRPIERLQESEAEQVREFRLRKRSEPCAGSQWLINDHEWVEITEYPELDTIEVWTFVNQSGVMHPMHMHLVFFQVLDRQAFEEVGGQIVPIGNPIPPDPNETGWKDTVRVNPGEFTRVIARFEDYLGKYAYHCHILEHEDHEMMRQFEVVPFCPADVIQDRVVDVLDLLAVLTAWGQTSGRADINRDGVVDVLDLLELLAAWGPCPTA